MDYTPRNGTNVQQRHTAHIARVKQYTREQLKLHKQIHDLLRPQGTVTTMTPAEAYEVFANYLDLFEIATLSVDQEKQK